MYKQAYYRGGAVMNKTKLQWEKLFSEDRERKTKLMNILMRQSRLSSLD